MHFIGCFGRIFNSFFCTTGMGMHITRVGMHATRLGMAIKIDLRIITNLFPWYFWT